jgi:hypothetical protein
MVNRLLYPCCTAFISKRRPIRVNSKSGREKEAGTDLAKLAAAASSPFSPLVMALDLSSATLQESAYTDCGCNNP